MDSLPTEGEIYKGKVVKLESFGVFVDIEGFYANGLVHISQMAKDRVESPEDVASVGQEVFVKVLTVDPPDNARGRPKISLSMKYADQSTGADRDRNGIDLEQEQQRRRSNGNFQQAPVTLEAIYNTVCSKCKGKGHLASECFNVAGTTYELVGEDESEVFLSTEKGRQRIGDQSRGGRSGSRERDRASRHASPSACGGSLGRGRGATLPSWMTKDEQPGAVSAGREEDRGRVRKRVRKSSRSRSFSADGRESKSNKDTRNRRHGLKSDGNYSFSNRGGETEKGRQRIGDQSRGGRSGSRERDRASRHASPSACGGSLGRGRGATLPSWMTKDEQPGAVSAGREEDRGRVRKRERSRSSSSRSRSSEDKKRKHKKHKKHKHHKSKSHKKGDHDDKKSRRREHRQRRDESRDRGRDKDKHRDRHRERARRSPSSDYR